MAVNAAGRGTVLCEREDRTEDSGVVDYDENDYCSMGNIRSDS